MEDGKAEIPLNVTVQGDVLVVIYHARSTLGGRLQAKVRARALVQHINCYHTLRLSSLYTLYGYYKAFSALKFCCVSDGFHEDVPDPVPHWFCAQKRHHSQVCKVGAKG